MAETEVSPVRRFLILKLQGPLQAWGIHTYEDFRPTLSFPTRSALLGLLGACLGIRRGDSAALHALSRSLRFAVRVDGSFSRLTDFHTVLDARKVGGKVSEYPVVSRREYLMTASTGSGFSVAVWESEQSDIGLVQVVSAIRDPVFTPCLGRRSCPLTRPLYESELEAVDAISALQQVPPVGGVVYSEEGSDELPQLRLRDVPIGRRQFASRNVFVHNAASRGDDVSKQG